MPQMKHPNGDVREIPAELVKKYETKGWTTASSSNPRSTKKEQA